MIRLTEAHKDRSTGRMWRCLVADDEDVDAFIDKALEVLAKGDVEADLVRTTSTSKHMLLFFPSSGTIMG